MAQWGKLVAEEYRKVKQEEIQNEFDGWEKRRIGLIKAKGGGIKP